MLTISNLRRQLNHVVPFSQENIKISKQELKIKELQQDLEKVEKKLNKARN